MAMMSTLNRFGGSVSGGGGSPVSSHLGGGGGGSGGGGGAGGLLAGGGGGSGSGGSGEGMGTPSTSANPGGGGGGGGLTMSRTRSVGSLAHTAACAMKRRGTLARLALAALLILFVAVEIAWRAFASEPCDPVPVDAPVAVLIAGKVFGFWFFFILREYFISSAPPAPGWGECGGDRVGIVGLGWA